MTIVYIFSLISLIIGLGVIPMTFIEKTPIKIFYLHYLYRKPINWILLFVLLIWTLVITKQQAELSIITTLPLLLGGLGLFLAYILHPENAFKAIEYPVFTNDISNLPIAEDQEIAVIEVEGITKCYPLDYVIHHHIINDFFDKKIIALTYCAMCRSVIPFDITELGPLFVVALKNGNMVIADKETKTFFQQSTFKSLIGKLHPSDLTMIPFQVLTWSDVKDVMLKPNVVKVSKKDFRPFELPIPGIWEKVVSSELVPGLATKNHDKSFPARTRIIGITDPRINDKIAYLRKEIINEKLVYNKKNNFFMVASTNAIIAFKSTLNNLELKIKKEENRLIDVKSETQWNIRGEYISGPIRENLEIVTISDEYWFSWKKENEKSIVIRL